MQVGRQEDGAERWQRRVLGREALQGVCERSRVCLARVLRGQEHSRGRQSVCIDVATALTIEDGSVGLACGQEVRPGHGEHVLESEGEHHGQKVAEQERAWENGAIMSDTETRLDLRQNE